jgi:hypothetical protein
MVLVDHVLFVICICSRFPTLVCYMLQAPNPFSWDGFMAARNKQRQPEAGRSNRPEPLQSSKHPEASVGGKDFASQPEIAKSRAELGKGPRAQQAKSRAKPAGAAATAEASTTVSRSSG